MDKSSKRLTVAYATCCIIDLFGVFPIIALPRTIVDCGWLGIPLAFLVFGIQVYTAIILGKSWTIAEIMYPEISSKSRSPYPALTELALGRRISQLVSFFLDVGIFAAGIPNLLISAQNLQILGLKLSNNQFDFSFCYWLIILSMILCPIMWLGSPKDMKWLALTSVCTVCAVSILTWNCIMKTNLSGIEVFHPDPTWQNLAIAFGILAFQFDIHPSVLSIQMDMEHRNQLATPIITSFLITGGLFTVTTCLAYVKLGNGAYFNLLQGLDASGALYLDLGLVTAQIFLSMVIGTSALFQHIEYKLGISSEFNLKRCLLRSLLVALLVFLGGCVPRFDLIMGLIGGFLTAPLVFILPPILYIKFKDMQLRRRNKPKSIESEALLRPQRDGTLETLRDLERSNNISPLSNQEKILNQAVVIFGLVATILSTYFSLKNTILYARFSPSCAMNLTAASELLF